MGMRVNLAKKDIPVEEKRSKKRPKMHLFWKI
jgi:hypothetical protein